MTSSPNNPRDHSSKMHAIIEQENLDARRAANHPKPSTLEGLAEEYQKYHTLKPQYDAFKAGYIKALQSLPVQELRTCAVQTIDEGNSRTERQRANLAVLNFDHALKLAQGDAE